MIICMILATVVFVIYFFLFLTAGKKESVALLTALKEQNTEEETKNKVETSRMVAKARANQKTTDKKTKKQAQALQKKTKEIEQKKEALENGNMNLSAVLTLPGYRIMSLGKIDTTNGAVDKLRRQCELFMERDEAMHRAGYLLANLLSFVMLGAGTGFLLSGIVAAMGMDLLRAAVIGFSFFILIAIVGYLPYSNVNVIIKERKEAIENQFPQVISKLTLLVTAGLEVRQAWEMTCEGEGILYDEMNRVLLDLRNNVSTALAYSRFLKRCNNPYVTKLSTAIIQNTTQGNAKIAEVFRGLNDECWLEYKHSSRRKGEAIESKLLIPTILMFLGIIILVVVPMLSGFNF